MRVALISDLHGNQVSLAAVFADIDRNCADRNCADRNCADRNGVDRNRVDRNRADRKGIDRNRVDRNPVDRNPVDEVICLGDVATLGPRPSEVIAMLQQRGCRCILGNHDAFMIDEDLIRSYSEVPIVVDSVDWCRERLSADEIAYLAGFELNITLDLGGGVEALLFHGSPRSHMEDLLATTDADELDKCLGQTDATVLAGGHTHIQMVRQHRGMLLVNPGSVGMPFKEFVDGQAPKIMPYAEYAIIETDGAAVQVSLRRVPIDKESLRREAAASSNPICRSLEQQYA